MLQQAAGLPHDHAFLGHAAQLRHDELGHAEQAGAPLPEQQEQDQQGNTAEHGGVEVSHRANTLLCIQAYCAAVVVSMNWLL
ncbi:hypothetical protein D3C72_2107060 [compost metagenome]